MPEKAQELAVTNTAQPIAVELAPAPDAGVAQGLAVVAVATQRDVEIAPAVD